MCDTKTMVEIIPFSNYSGPDLKNRLRNPSSSEIINDNMYNRKLQKWEQKNHQHTVQKLYNWKLCTNTYKNSLLIK